MQRDTLESGDDTNRVTILVTLALSLNIETFSLLILLNRHGRILTDVKQKLSFILLDEALSD